MNVKELKALLRDIPDHHEVVNENGGQKLVKIEVGPVDLPAKGQRHKLWLTFR